MYLRGLIIAILLLQSTFSFSQVDTLEIKEQIKEAKTDAWVRLGFGILGHVTGFSALLHGPLSKPKYRDHFIIYNITALFSDIGAIDKFIQVKKLKKELDDQIEGKE